MNAAAASPMSSTPTVTLSLIQRWAIHAMKTSETTTAATAAAAKGRQPRIPSPVITTGRRCGPEKTAVCCTRGAYARLLMVGPRYGKFLGVC